MKCLGFQYIRKLEKLNCVGYICVVRHPKRHPTQIQVRMTLPIRPHAIFSTLQGTQDPDTKPTLQRAKNANAQPTHPG